MWGTSFYQFLFVIFITMGTCTSLECYTCSSQLGIGDVRNDCENFYYSSDEHHKISRCLYADSVCAKYVVDHSGLRWVHRSCQHHDICSVLNARYSNEMNMLIDCETCADKNLCNTSSILMPSLVITLVLLVVVKVAMF